MNTEISKIALLLKKDVLNGSRINSPDSLKQIHRLIELLNKEPFDTKIAKLTTKKIALVIPYHPLYETGGLEIGTVKFAQNLSKIGNHVEIISKGIYQDKNLVGKIISPGGTIVHGVGSGIEDIIPYLLDNSSDFDIIQWMEIFPPIPEDEAVYNDKAEQQYLASILFRALGLRVFLYVATSGNVTNRGVNNPKWNHTHPQQFLNKYLQNAMSGFNMINSDIITEYQKAGIDIPKNKYEVIALGVDTDTFIPVDNVTKMKIRKNLKIPQNKTVFICLGRFVKRKKQDLLFSVWENLPEETKNQAQLMFVGGGAGKGQPDSIYDTLHQKLTKYLNYRNNNGKEIDILNVDLVSHQDIVKYIQASDAMFFPSEREGLGLVVLETMSCEKPVFASNISGVNEIINNKSLGTLFPPNDKNSIVYYINDFLHNSSKYLADVSETRLHVVKNWSWQSLCKKLDVFYNQF